MHKYHVDAKKVPVLVLLDQQAFLDFAKHAGIQQLVNVLLFYALVNLDNAQELRVQHQQLDLVLAALNVYIVDVNMDHAQA